MKGRVYLNYRLDLRLLSSFASVGKERRREGGVVVLDLLFFLLPGIKGRGGGDFWVRWVC